MARTVHFRAPHRGADRSNAGIASTVGLVAPACVPQIVLGPRSRYKLHDAPAAVTCEACRESWEFQQRVREGYAGGAE